MRRDEFAAKVREIVEEDPRYRPQVYHFVAEAVSFTAKRIRDQEGGSRHISGWELLDGIRDFALEKYGPLALDVLEDWGVTRTEDFGNIVFRMVSNGLLGASDNDTPADFAAGYDFREAFLKSYVLEPDETMPQLEKIV